MLLRIATSLLLLTLGPGASCFRPRSDIGSPAGLVPECKITFTYVYMYVHDLLFLVGSPTTV